MSFGKIDIKVNGVSVKTDLDEELEINDIDEDMKRVAAQMAYWGSVWAAAEAEREQAEAYYRNWRADKGEQIMKADPKLAEWKVKQRIEADASFSKLKGAQAAALQNATLARSVFESFRTKANVLQSKGAMYRAELDHANVRTPTQPKSKRQQQLDSEREERVSAMRSTNTKRKAKKPKTS